MVTRQIQARDVDDPNVLTAMRTVPRHVFVRPPDSRRAYGDRPIPIGLGQTISQPYIVGYMTDALKLEPDHKVLEVGTGSGYQAAVCAEIARQVYTIEIIEELADSAKKRLKELGYGNVIVKAGDGYFGWPEHGPFDAVIITAATPLVPSPLIEQLKPGGLMILPLGSPYGSQVLVLITKAQDEKITSKRLLPVGFVPMTGHVTEVK
jgi:protein-L-isoaspartate(D-aspartate) O-methyltransferase